MFSYITKVISSLSLVFSKGNIVDRQLNRIGEVEKITRFPDELSVIISSYEVTIDTSSYERIEHEYLPDLIERLKDLNYKLQYQGTARMRAQKQLTDEMILFYKDAQFQIKEKKQKIIERKGQGHQKRGFKEHQYAYGYEYFLDPRSM